MAKKRRTKKQKFASQAAPVKDQFTFSFDSGTIKNKRAKKNEISEEFGNLGSIKKDLFRSLIISSLIIGSILMLYWAQ